MPELTLEEKHAAFTEVMVKAMEDRTYRENLRIDPRSKLPWLDDGQVARISQIESRAFYALIDHVKSRDLETKRYLSDTLCAAIRGFPWVREDAHYSDDQWPKN